SLDSVATPETEEGRRPQMSGSRPTVLGAPQLRSTLETVGLVVAPTTLVTGLLFYFGRVYTTARLSYFGIEPSVVGFSMQEYLLRSIQPIFVPLGVLALIGLTLIWTHSILSRWTQGDPPRRALNALFLALGLGGLVLVAAGVAGLWGHPVFGIDLLITPVSFAFGTIGLSYAISLRRRMHKTRVSEPRWRSLASLTLVSVLVILSTFWAMGDWAAGLGRGRAQALADQLASRAPGVILYSTQSLSIDPATGVTMERIEEDGSPYRVRYRGLKLFLRSGGKYFLLPASWSPSTGVVIVLPDSDALRVEFTPR
ncbi:MAG: hypothetical protein ACRDJF_08440, partial [Actinomycetota bacterium]